MQQGNGRTGLSRAMDSVLQLMVLHMMANGKLALGMPDTASGQSLSLP